MTATSSAFAPIRGFWQARQPRERALLAIAATLVLVTLAWSCWLQPALKLWQSAPATRIQSAQQMVALQALAAQAAVLRTQPRLDPERSRQAGLKSVADLGGQASVEGVRINASLPRVSAAAIANWLQAVGPQTGARVVRASLQESEPGFWTGQISLELP